jgi:hypothetical protein
MGGGVVGGVGRWRRACLRWRPLRRVGSWRGGRSRGCSVGDGVADVSGVVAGVAVGEPMDATSEEVDCYPIRVTSGWVDCHL